MRIFVSSSFEDLKDHRASAIRVLRQLGHEVIAMEDMTAGSLAPLAKVLEMVDRSEAYVGIFAWRYGYAPQVGAESPPVVAGATPGQTSVTDYEYLHAIERGLPVMAFLLDERWPWPPEFVDGFDQTRAGAQPNTNRIRALRLALQQERVVSWFTTPTDLEARVSAAVTTAGLTNQLDLQAAAALPPGAGVAGDSSAEQGITQATITAGDHQRALKIDLATTWWSTRLYLIASLAQRLTQARRILVADASTQPQATNLKASSRAKSASSASSRPPPSFRSSAQNRRNFVPSRTACVRGPSPTTTSPPKSASFWVFGRRPSTTVPEIPPTRGKSRSILRRRFYAVGSGR
jgi:hypothetical protein